jgi:hypothetical protein
VFDELFSQALAWPTMSADGKRALARAVYALETALAAERLLPGRREEAAGWQRLLRVCRQLRQDAAWEPESGSPIVDDISAATALMILRQRGDLEESATPVLESEPLSLEQRLYLQLKKGDPTFLNAIAPPLNDADVRLALSWTVAGKMGAFRADPPWTLRAIVEAVNPDDNRDAYWEIERCLSARRAELFVADLMRASARLVEDTSALQLLAPGDERWCIADLVVDGTPVDVKNTRVTRDDRQTWQVVKRFKQSDAGVPVRYDGVRSRVRPLQAYSDASEPDDVVYLGSITAERLGLLRQLSPSEVTVETERFDGHRTRLPGWCFALPSGAYAHTLAAATQLRELRVSGLPDNRSQRTFERVLWASFGLANPWPGEVGDHVLLGMADLLAREGRWPALMILSLLGAFQGELAGGTQFRSINPYALFHPRRSYPVCVYDPTESVFGFYESLMTLLKSGDPVLQSVVSLRLRGPSHLEGVQSDGKAIPLVVHCGKCSKYPLVRGRADHCEHATGRLRCDRCGWCPCGDGSRDSSASRGGPAASSATGALSSRPADDHWHLDCF